MGRYFSITTLLAFILNFTFTLASLDHDGTSLSRRAENSEKKGHSTFFIVSACLIPFLVITSGILAGLTLGYMSLDETQLRVLSVSGTPQQQAYAKKIQPIRQNGHLLLTTLLLGNMVVNETLPVLSEEVLGGGVQAVVVSTVLIVLFAEIIPQSLCSRYGLQIGAFMATPTQFLIYALFILAWPISKLLELVLGPHQGIVYRRSELKELINMHSELSKHGGDLTTDTVTMVGGALDFQEKVVQDCMTPISEVFMLPIEAKLDYTTLAEVVKRGHSRIPVYETRTVGGQCFRKVLGILLVKQCILLDPEDATPLREIPLNKVPVVPFDEPLLGILDRFQEGHSHMAIVTRVSRVAESRDDQGSVNLETKVGLTKRFLNAVGLSDHDEEPDHDVDVEKADGSEKEGDDSKKATLTVPEAATASFRRTLLNASTALEQTMPSDAVLSQEGAQKFIADMEQPFGIITLEDVIEELIGEEILDEYDEPEAGAASTFVPEEAQRVVEEAAKANDGPLKATANSGRGLPSRNALTILALRRTGTGTGTGTGTRAPTRSSSLPGQPRPAPGQSTPGEPTVIVTPAEPEIKPSPSSSKIPKGAFKSKMPPEVGAPAIEKRAGVAFADKDKDEETK